jgi:ABC-2 type transport system ATP-binding protein
MMAAAKRSAARPGVFGGKPRQGVQRLLRGGHVMAEAERCDRVALMAEGRMLACGPPASLRAATGTIVAVIEAHPWQRAYAELAARWPGTTLRGTTIRVSVPAGADPRSLLAESLSTVRVERIHVTDPSFEDAFIWFIRHSHPVMEPP